MIDLNFITLHNGNGYDLDVRASKISHLCQRPSGAIVVLDGGIKESVTETVDEIRTKLAALRFDLKTEADRWVADGDREP